MLLFGGVIKRRCSYKFCKIIKNTFFQEILLVAASHRVNTDEAAPYYVKLKTTKSISKTGDVGKGK